MLKRLIKFIPFVAGIAVAVIVVFVNRAEQASHHQTIRAHVLHGLSDVKADMVRAVAGKTQLVRALEFAIQSNRNLSQQAFAAIATGLLKGTHDVRSVQLARNGVVTHAFPEDSDSRAIGRNPIESGPAILRALAMRAMKTGQVQIVFPKPDKLHLEDMIIFAPVPNAPDQRESGHWGMIILYIDAKAFLTLAGLPGSLDDVLISLRVPGRVTGASVILDGDPLVFEMAPILADIQVFSSTWQLAAVHRTGWTASPLSKYILGGGAICVLLVPVMLWFMISVFMGRFQDRKKYRYLVQTAKSIILRLDMAGKMEFCNEYAEQFYGYDPGELVGKSLVGTLIPEKNLEGESMKRFVGRLLKNPAAHPFNETMNVRKNGEIVWVSWANEPILASDGTMVGLLCVGTDITDRKLMEESLRQREKQYRLLAENVTDVIWGLDADLRYTYVSPSDEDVRGFRRYEVLGLPIEDFLAPASLGRLSKVLSVLENRMSDQSVPPSVTEDLEFLCADGTTVWLESKLGLLLNEDGHQIGIQGVSRDITDRKRAEALREDMERMAKHDLKTPLGAVIGLPDEIRRNGPVTPEQGELLDTIENAGNAMLSLINRSLDLYKMECGSFQLNKKPVDVVEVIEQVKNEAQAHIREKGISIGIEVGGVDNGSPFLADVDAELFKSMISNLLLNALEASPDSGSVSIILQKGEAIFITIRNKGEVPFEIRNVFFDKYATSNAATGSGLGTYSARLIARTHEGDITVDSSVAGETSVTVTLPE